jgi:hypothetical protein
MQTREMCLCDSCGDYHPVEDCEVVVVKMIVGKNCDIKKRDIHSPIHVPKGTTIFVPEENIAEKKEEPEEEKMAVTVKKPLKDLTPTEKALEDIYNPNHSDIPIKLDPARTSIIPPHLRGLMKPPGPDSI